MLSQPKRLGLLGYLALAARDGHCRRDSLLALFWPELDNHRARRALNQSLYVLRQELGTDILSLRGEEEVRANPDNLWCDATRFDAMVRSGELAEALSLYRGDLLVGFHLDGCPDFERWVDSERARLARHATEAAVRLADREQEAANPVGCLHWLREASRLAPYEEPLQLRLLVALHDLGDRAGALREYETFRERLARELDLEPSEELVREAERLRHVNGGPRPALLATAPVATATLVPRAARQGRRLRRSWLATATGGLLAIGGLLYLGARITRGEGGTEPQRVVVLALENLTGDSALGRLGRIAGDRIADGLARSGLVQVVSPAALWPGDEQALIRDAERGLVVRGSLAGEGDRLVFRGEVAEARTGNLLRAVSVATRKTEPMVGIEALRSQITGALVAVVDPRLASWIGKASQPPSLEAYQFYVDGLDLLTRSEWAGAAAALERAARVDSGFTSPLLWALYARQAAGEFPLADSLVAVLEPRRDRLPAWDRAMLDFLRGRLSGDQEAAYRAIRRVAELMPGSEWLFLRAAQALMVNRPREAVEVLRRLESRDNRLANRLTYRWLTDALHRLGEYKAELEAAERARRLGVELSPLAELRSLAALGREREIVAKLESALATRQRDWSTGYLLWAVIAELQAHQGPLTDSVTRLGLQWYGQGTAEERNDPLYRRSLGNLLFLAGREAEANTIFEDLQNQVPRVPSVSGRRVPRPWAYAGPLGVLAARRGDRAEAVRLAEFIESHRGRHDYGEGTVWRAAIAAQLGDLAGGTSLFRQAMGQGLYLVNDLFIRSDLAPLREYPPFQELLRPR